MKWKDTGHQNEEDLEQVDSYYEDDGYDVLGKNEPRQTSGVGYHTNRYRTWGIGVLIALIVVFLVMSIFSNLSGSSKAARIDELEERVESLVQQMKKMDVVDEKVTRIWEQAKAFETFKARFDRSEASTSLRMDHLAMSLDELQKKTDDALARIAALEKRPPPRTVVADKPPAKKATKEKRHTVVAGETLYSISRRYGLSVDQLKSLNKLSDDAILHVGQTLVVR